MLAERLGKAWSARRGSTSVDAVMRFSSEGLVLGAGTVLAPAGRSGRDVAIDPVEPRLLALLAAAHLRRPTAGSLAHLRKAAECWRQREDALAAMHLALSQVDRLQQPEADAHRLFLADGLLKAGIDAATIIDAVEAAAQSVEPLDKYSPDQPRVPAGSGGPSGQWTAGESGSSANTTSSGPPDARPARGSVPQATRPQSLAQAPQSEVNPSTVTPVVERHVGDDACHRAKVDCMEHLLAEGHIRGDRGWALHKLIACANTEKGCLAVGLFVEKHPDIPGGGAIFPDGGTVLIEKGKEDIYIPRRPPLSIPPPFRRGSLA